MASKLTAKSQKCGLLDSNMKTLKEEDFDLSGRVKMVLSKLNIVKPSLNRINTGSKKLDDILCSQKAHTDEHGIGDADEVSTSTAKGTNCFVKNLVVINYFVSVAYRALKKKNVLRPERILAYHDYGVE